MKAAIHAVFIAKENILFLEEWIDYHLEMGFGPFYLYDNSKVEKKSRFDAPNKAMIPQKINKHGVRYDDIVPLNKEQITAILLAISDRYKDLVIFIEWSPLDETGAVCYEQEQAHNDCLARLKQTEIVWCASIDIDEFIVLHTNYTNINTYLIQLKPDVRAVYMSQIRFETRFKNIGKPIISTSSGPVTNVPYYHSNKYIYRVKSNDYLDVHNCKGSGQYIRANIDQLHFNHYNSTSIELHSIESDISTKLIEHISANYKNYIVHQYLPSNA